MARVDYDKQSAVYDEGRFFAPAERQEWRAALVPFLAPGMLVLDLGSGTGRWATTLVEWFGVRIIGVEPSSGMREQAAAKPPSSSIAYIGGRAEAIPARDDRFDGAWLSDVLHHLDDMAGAARELHRVLRPGAPVLIRQGFSERVGGITLFRFFPGAREVAETFPTLGEAIDVLTDAGFAEFQALRVTQRTAPNLAALIPKVRLRADTTLELISDEEFERGLELLEETARVEHGPVLDSLDLLVVR